MEEWTMVDNLTNSILSFAVAIDISIVIIISHQIGTIFVVFFQPYFNDIVNKYLFHFTKFTIELIAN